MRIPVDPTDRRALFRSTFGRWVESVMQRTEQRVVTKRYLRPPGALPEVGFLAACTRCGLCVDPCPPGAIRLATSDGGLAAGTPYIDVSIEPCIACPDMPCAKACPTGALTLPPGGWTGYRLAALELVTERCVTFQGKPCTVCADSCPIGSAALAIDEGGHPVIKPEGCVGCGVCVRACITTPSSLTLTPLEA
jgi:MauM/NapG family ferredoxin protein